MRLVLASHNPHKLSELQALLAPLQVQLVSQEALGVHPAPEPFETFIENALCKARHAASCTQAAAIADDSGLCVEALHGAPGVHSARYATVMGHPAGDAHNNEVLRQQMHGHTHRRAQLVCTLVAVRHASDPQPLVATGRWSLEVLSMPVGEGGFGYDPMLWHPGLGCSVAQLSPSQKNQYSHRGVAMRDLLALMREVWFA